MSTRDVLIDSNDGILFLARLLACERAALFPHGVDLQLFRRLDDEGLSTAEECLARAKELLVEVVDESVHAALRAAFARAYERFEVVRIVTDDCWNLYYAQPSSNGNESSHSGRELLYRDPDHLPSFASVHTRLGTRLEPIPRPAIELSPYGRAAFVTSISEWQRIRRGDMTFDGNLADRAVDWLGLPYTIGTGLYVILVGVDADIAWCGMRRPTLLDAADHAWWWCWEDDAAGHGHASVISSLRERRLERGGKEWVVDHCVIATERQTVTCRYLDITERDTTPAAQPAARSLLVRLSVIAAGAFR